MKKIILTTTILIITLTSCYDNKPEVNITKTTKTPKPFSIDTSELGLGGSGVVTASDKHEYLITDNLKNYQGFEHYIDCEFCLKREQATYGNH
jgi:hypothetical protein